MFESNRTLFERIALLQTTTVIHCKARQSLRPYLVLAEGFIIVGYKDVSANFTVT